jgi:rhamnosyltransferase
MKKISIIIPTYNAGTLIKEVLTAIFNQTLKPYEVIVIDSCSTDETTKIVKSFPIKFIKIKKRDFNHGKTRNYGASIADGEYVVFITQDAVPKNNVWLASLVKPLETKTIAGVFSRQIAWENAIPMERFFYNRMYPKTSVLINSHNARKQEILFSNASSAIRKTFLKAHPFAEDILMSEDMEWALRIIREGFKICYESKSQVTHSHNTSFTRLFKRYFDFGVSHSEINAKEKSWSLFRKGSSYIAAEITFLISTNNWYLIPRSFYYNAAKIFGLICGRSHRVIPKYFKRKFTSYYTEYWP